MVDKREAIMTAAMELFAERGFYGTPVPLIAEKAQVGSGTIYRYFKDKEALVNELYRHLKQEMFSCVGEDLGEEVPLRSICKSSFTNWVNYAITNQHAYKFLESHHHQPYLDAESQALSEGFRNQFAAILATGQEQQILKDDVPPEALVAFVSGIVHEAVKAHWVGYLELTPEIIDKIEEMAWQAIRN